jgi:hypothetical protein
MELTTYYYRTEIREPIFSGKRALRDYFQGDVPRVDLLAEESRVGVKCLKKIMQRKLAFLHGFL